MRIAPDRLALTQELHALLIDYWHDVDTHWGRSAPDYYTEDGVFEGPAASYAGREKIRAFYNVCSHRGAPLAAGRSPLAVRIWPLAARSVRLVGTGL